MNCSTAWVALQSLEGGIQLTSPQTTDAHLLAAELDLCLHEGPARSEAKQRVCTPAGCGIIARMREARLRIASQWQPTDLQAAKALQAQTARVQLDVPSK